jgi:hypothetical protein
MANFNCGKWAKDGDGLKMEKAIGLVKIKFMQKLNGEGLVLFSLSHHVYKSKLILSLILSFIKIQHCLNTLK